jgi:formylglycine-generating enzyme required for sulfatase activity
VESVSWDDCQIFLQQLNLLDPEYHYRLPSEAEWEYACRAGTATRFYSGNEESDMALIGWYSKNSGSTTETVGSKLPNSWGLYDMSGNVWEWCEDYYHEDYSQAPDDSSPWLDGGTGCRVSRGGSIGSAARRCRSAARDECYQGLRYYFLGLRVVRTPV